MLEEGYRCPGCNMGFGECCCTNRRFCMVCNVAPCVCTKAGPSISPIKYTFVDDKIINNNSKSVIVNDKTEDEFMKMITAKITEAEKTVAVKADKGKTDWSLLPIESVEEIIKVLEFGATKYDDWNWSTGNGFKYTRVFNATMRHLWAWFRGEDNDPETGLSHWAHAGCNVLFMLHFIKNKERYNQDDRKFSRAK